METLLRLVCAGALTLMVTPVWGQDSPPAPGPARVAPTSPEAAPSTSPAVVPARKIPNPATDTPTLTGNAARAQADAEHQAARARCEVHAKPDEAACLREADEAYDRALASQNPGQPANPGSSTGAKGS